MANGNGNGRTILVALLTIAVSIILFLGGTFLGQNTVASDLSCFRDDTISEINEQSERITALEKWSEGADKTLDGIGETLKDINTYLREHGK